jgi:16S rRNA (cytidine1402-2'-O)-methyltransferase
VNSAARGALHLVPVPLGGGDIAAVLPQSARDALMQIDYFIVENEKSARHFLAGLPHPRPIRELSIALFDKSGTPVQAKSLLEPVESGRHAAILSEAGCPGIADPGAILVDCAHRANLRVIPHVGPSALLLALMASGFNGQHFAFHGYLPVAADACSKEITRLESESRGRDVTQLFIETPYRNDALLKSLLVACQARTRLCIASDLTLPTETVVSDTVAGLRNKAIVIGKRPTVFLLYAH